MTSQTEHFYSSPYGSIEDESFSLPASPPPTKEEQKRMNAEKDKYLENNAKFPFSADSSKYKIKSKIGQGTFGEVFTASLRSDETIEVAMKKLIIRKDTNGFPMTSLREVGILKKLTHDNIVKLIEVCQTKACHQNNFRSTYFMVFELCDHDLAGIITNQKIKFELSDIKEMMRQLLSGMFFIHSNMILHRDIKSANILLTKNGVLKIADFGLARTYRKPTKEEPNNYTSCVVTIWYRSPELLLGERNYGPPIDIWGVGCIMAEMWTRTPILQGSTDQAQLNLISNLCGSITPKVWPKVTSLNLYNNIKLIKGQRRKVINKLKSFTRNVHACDLVDKLLKLDPEQRISANDALNHDFFWTDPMPRNLSKLMSSLKYHNYEFLMRNRNIATNNTSNSNASSTSSSGFPDHIF